MFDFSDNDEACDLLNIISHSNDNLFLTGRAGTGKTTLLNQVLAQTKKKHIALAPTGIAALNIGGRTIHSFFQFPLAPLLPTDPINYEYRQEKRDVVENLELLVIDEISMVRVDIIDAIDRTLRHYRKSILPFGGVQLLLVGDSFQLPPIIKPEVRTILQDHFKGGFFFDANVFQNNVLLTIELKKVYRQQEGVFLKLLDKIRINEITRVELDQLNERAIDKNNRPKDALTIATTTYAVDQINSWHISSLETKPKTYSGIITGQFKELPVKRDLVLKRDAQVMLMKNDKNGRWVNGTIGTVVELYDDSVQVRLNSGVKVIVEPENWINREFLYDKVDKKVTTKEIGRFTQLPLSLCWAITIHKSQGLTFDKVCVDLGSGTWDSGQAYVAFSRCRSFEGLYLMREITERDIKLDPQILVFSESFNNEEVYKSSYKAQATNKKKLFEKLSIDANLCDFEQVVKDVDEILALSIDLVTSFFLLSSKAWCCLRLRNDTEANKTIAEMQKYFTIKKIITPVVYDSTFSAIKAAAFLNNVDTRPRGLELLKTLLEANMPDTITILKRMMIDLDEIKNEF